jgi:hypothetical protein
MKKRKLTPEEITKQEQQRAARLTRSRDVAFHKLGKAVKSRVKVRLNPDEAAGVMITLRRALEAGEVAQDTVRGLAPMLHALKDTIDHWNANPKERLTLPKTLTFLSDRLAEVLTPGAGEGTPSVDDEKAA